MKKILFFIFTATQLLQAIEIISYGVDGKNYNTDVVIHQRNPVVFFEYIEGYVVKNFEIKLSSFSSGLISGSTIWYVNQTTTSLNTLNNITRIEIPSTQIGLKVRTTYYLMITVYDISSTSVTLTDTFFTTLSAAKLEGNIILEVDYKNPFSPKMGETTQIRYKTNKDTQIKICVFSISGKFIRSLVDNIALKDMVYTVSWDGKDENGVYLPSGIYIVSLIIPEETPVTKLIGIVEKK
ncbi:MAG: hypothetical protein ABDH23_00200 [Endomicrobiia bacterium]